MIQLLPLFISGSGCHNKIAQSGLNTEIYILEVLETGNPRSKCQHGQVLVRALL